MSKELNLNERVSVIEKRILRLETKLEILLKAYPKSKRELSNEERLQKINDFINTSTNNP